MITRSEAGPPAASYIPFVLQTSVNVTGYIIDRVELLWRGPYICGWEDYRTKIECHSSFCGSGQWIAGNDERSAAILRVANTKNRGCVWEQERTYAEVGAWLSTPSLGSGPRATWLDWQPLQSVKYVRKSVVGKAALWANNSILSRTPPMRAANLYWNFFVETPPLGEVAWVVIICNGQY